MEKLYTVNENKTRSCGSDHELLIAKFRLKVKKLEETTKLFRYDLNQILSVVSDSLLPHGL